MANSENFKEGKGAPFYIANLFTVALVTSWNQRFSIVGNTSDHVVNIHGRYIIVPDPYRLILQGLSFAYRILRSPHSLPTAFGCKTEDQAVEKILKSYIYSYVKCLLTGIKGPNLDLGEEDLAFEGHVVMHQMIKNRTITHCVDVNATVTRVIELELKDDDVVFNVVKCFKFLDESFESDFSGYRYYNREHETTLEKLRVYNNYHSSSGLNFNILKLGVQIPMLLDPTKCPLGNTCLAKNGNSTILVSPPQEKITHSSMIFGPAIGLTFHSFKYETGNYETNLVDNFYKRIPWNRPLHLLKWEVKAMTGQLSVEAVLSESDFEKYFDVVKAKSLKIPSYLLYPGGGEPDGDTPSESSKS